MLRLTALIYVLVGTVLTGAAVTAVLASPSLADDFKKWIPVAAGCGALAALPISFLVAKAILAQIKKG